MRKILLLVMPLVVVAACAGGTQRDASDDDSGHNAADIEFVQQMIPHHEQAVAMSELPTGTRTDSVVVDLASRIETDQQAEIDLMRRWLDEWGVDEAADDQHGAHGDDTRMHELESAGGLAFARLWITMMIDHHTDAITMAEAQLVDGKDPAVKELARRIIETQQREIAEMKATGFA